MKDESQMVNLSMQDEQTRKILNRQLEMEDGKITEKGWADVADILQTYSDKRFETARYLFIQDGKIVRHVAISCQNPSATISKFDEDFLFKLKTFAEREDASVVFVHNHPSGYVVPSTADVNTTDYMGNFFADRFAGHIILDHGNFGIYHPDHQKWNLMIDGKFYDLEQGQYLLDFGESVLQIPQLRGRKDFRLLADYAKQVDDGSTWNKDKWVPSFYVTHSGFVQSLEFIMNESLERKNYEATKNRIRNSGREAGCNHVIFVPKTHSQKLLCEAFAQESGMVKDVYYEKDDGTVELSNYHGGDIFNTWTKEEIVMSDQVVEKEEMGAEIAVEQNNMEGQELEKDTRFVSPDQVADGLDDYIEMMDANGGMSERAMEEELMNMEDYEDGYDIDETDVDIEDTEPIIQYNENGQIIYEKHQDGYEKKYEYDEDGNLIHTEDSKGYQIWQKYDQNGNEVYYENTDGYKQWHEYDQNGKETWFKDSTGKERGKRKIQMEEALELKEDPEEKKKSKTTDSILMEEQIEESPVVPQEAMQKDRESLEAQLMESQQRNEQLEQRIEQLERKIEQLVNAIEQQTRQYNTVVEENQALKGKLDSRSGSKEIREGNEQEGRPEYSEEGQDRGSSKTFNNETAFQVNCAVPMFGHMAEDGSIVLISNAHFSKRLLNNHDSSQNKVILTYADETGKTHDLELPEFEYHKMIKASQEYEINKAKVEDNSYEWLLYSERYDKAMNIGQEKLRLNFASNFIHNYRIMCKRNATNPQEAMDLANDLYEKMSDYEQVAFRKMRNDMGKKEFDRMLLEEFKNHTQGIENKNSVTLNNNDLLHEVNKQQFEVGQGEFIKDTKMRVGDSIRMSMKIKNMDGKYLRTPRLEFKILKASKNIKPEVAIVHNEEMNITYKVSLDDLIKHQKKDIKQRLKEEKEELRKDKKYDFEGHYYR